MAVCLFCNHSAFLCDDAWPELVFCEEACRDVCFALGVLRKDEECSALVPQPAWYPWFKQARDHDKEMWDTDHIRTVQRRQMVGFHNYYIGYKEFLRRFLAKKKKTVEEEETNGLLGTLETTLADLKRQYTADPRPTVANVKAGLEYMQTIKKLVARLDEIARREKKFERIRDQAVLKLQAAYLAQNRLTFYVDRQEEEISKKLDNAIAAMKTDEKKYKTAKRYLRILCRFAHAFQIAGRLRYRPIGDEAKYKADFDKLLGLVIKKAEKKKASAENEAELAAAIQELDTFILENHLDRDIWEDAKSIRREEVVKKSRPASRSEQSREKVRKKCKAASGEGGEIIVDEGEPIVISAPSTVSFPYVLLEEGQLWLYTKEGRVVIESMPAEAHFKINTNGVSLQESKYWPKMGLVLDKPVLENQVILFQDATEPLHLNIAYDMVMASTAPFTFSKLPVEFNLPSNCTVAEIEVELEAMVPEGEPHKILHHLVYATRDIKAGEELLVSMSKENEDKIWTQWADSMKPAERSERDKMTASELRPLFENMSTGHPHYDILKEMYSYLGGV